MSALILAIVRAEARAAFVRGDMLTAARLWAELAILEGVKP